MVIAWVVRGTRFKRLRVLWKSKEKDGGVRRVSRSVQIHTPFDPTRPALHWVWFIRLRRMPGLLIGSPGRRLNPRMGVVVPGPSIQMPRGRPFRRVRRPPRLAGPQSAPPPTSTPRFPRPRHPCGQLRPPRGGLGPGPIDAWVGAGPRVLGAGRQERPKSKHGCLLLGGGGGAHDQRLAERPPTPIRNPGTFGPSNQGARGRI